MRREPAPGAQYEQAASETEPTDGGSILVRTFSLPWELGGGVAQDAWRDSPSSGCGCSDFATYG